MHPHSKILSLPLRLLPWLVVLGTSLGWVAPAAEPEVTPDQLPRVPASEPGRAAATFKLKTGFRLELAAAEPDVISPVALSFDEDGRLYVIEMRDYSERRPERLGRVRLLEDTDGDGRFEKATVFAAGLPWPTAVTCWDGGVFVGATPDILYLKDTDGDGVADVREVIFAGFASDYAPFATNQLNVQALMNSFQWTLDNRIHGATSFSGGKVQLVDSPFVREWLQRAGLRPYVVFREPRILDLRGRDFSFDPRTLSLRAESGGGQHGMSFDDQGRKYVCSNSDHLQYLVYEDRYAGRNPWFAMPNPRISIAVDGPAAEVYRISPDEPWRVLRTAWRVSGQVKGPIEGGGRASGYFTGATGATLYRGDAYGDEYVGDAFIGDAGGNLVHRKKLRPDGVRMRAERPADEQKVEFLASTDNWFRPVQFANGPDGCLYIVDMYREVIEHPWSLPANLKKHLDLNSGSDRGRIWRVVPEGFRRPAAPKFSRLSAKALTPLLAHRNGWTRDTAARLIYERQDARALPALNTFATARTEPPLPRVEGRLAVLHSLYALSGMGALPEDMVVGWLQHADEEELRVHALRLAERFLRNASVSPAMEAALRERIAAARSHAHPTAEELQLVFTLGELRGPLKRRLFCAYLEAQFPSRQAVPTLEEVDPARITADLEWVGPAMMSGAGDDLVALAEDLAPRPRILPEVRDEMLFRLARAVGTRNRGSEVDRLLEGAGRAGLASSAAVLGGLQEGLGQQGASLFAQPALGRLEETFTRAVRAAMPRQPEAEMSERLPAIRLLAFAPGDAARSNLLWLVTATNEWKGYRAAALQALERRGGVAFAADLLGNWILLTPALRAEALELLLTKADRIRALLEAVEGGVVSRTDISLERQVALREHRDAAVRELARRAFGKAAEGSRQSVVDAFRPALQQAGDAAKGRTVFLNRCASCHRLGSDGHTLGPDLATMRGGGKEKLLIGLLDPNREVAPNFASYNAETRDGGSYTGVIASENAGSVTLRQAGGTEVTLLRANLLSLQSQGRSLMPEGLEEGLATQDVADLMEFILAP